MMKGIQTGQSDSPHVSEHDGSFGAWNSSNFEDLLANFQSDEEFRRTVVVSTIGLEEPNCRKLTEQEISAYETILDSGLFLASWYCDRYSLEFGSKFALLHYVLYGHTHHFNPNPYFDPRWYIHQFKNKEYAAKFPLLHYIRAGASSAKDPSPKFSVSQYRNLIDLEVKHIADEYLLRFHLENSLHTLNLPFSSEISRDVSLIIDSGIFDEEWYAKKYLSDVETGSPAIWYLL